jgi:hypothetical protein
MYSREGGKERSAGGPVGGVGRENIRRGKMPTDDHVIGQHQRRAGPVGNGPGYFVQDVSWNLVAMLGEGMAPILESENRSGSHASIMSQTPVMQSKSVDNSGNHVIKAHLSGPYVLNFS